MGLVLRYPLAGSAVMDAGGDCEPDRTAAVDRDPLPCVRGVGVCVGSRWQKCHRSLAPRKSAERPSKSALPFVTFVTRFCNPMLKNEQFLETSRKHRDARKASIHAGLKGSENSGKFRKKQSEGGVKQALYH